MDPSESDRVLPFLVWLVRRLAVRHQVSVVSLAQGRTPASYPWCGATVHDLGLAGQAGPLFWLRAAPRLRAALSAIGPVDIVHGLWLGAPGVIAAGAARIRGVPSVVSVVGGELAAIPDIGYGGALTWRGRRLARASLRLASWATGASGGTCNQLRAFQVGVDEIALGVDPAWTAPEQPLRPGPPFRLLHVAHLNAVKDQATLIDAFAMLLRRVPATLDIIGEDTLRGRIQQRAEDRGVASSVRFHGGLPFADVAGHYTRAHVLVHASRHEGGPLVVLEAAMHGVPTVGTAVGHIADWAPERAVAVPVGNASALADGIAGLLADEERRRAMGRAAQVWARAHDADWTSRLLRSALRALDRRGRPIAPVPTWARTGPLCSARPVRRVRPSSAGP